MRRELEEIRIVLPLALQVLDRANAFRLRE
jgi:hypothetical protein